MTEFKINTAYLDVDFELKLDGPRWCPLCKVWYIPDEE